MRGGPFVEITIVAGVPGQCTDAQVRQAAAQPEVRGAGIRRAKGLEGPRGVRWRCGGVWGRFHTPTATHPAPQSRNAPPLLLSHSRITCLGGATKATHTAGELTGERRGKKK